ncbi:hypothetical protein G6F57_022438 [Rhizopus arrhizus]|nr:hypothetical protein G6F57_022438 [Rhizopus arrhizus]
MAFAIGARPVQCAGIPDTGAGLEQAGLGAHGAHDAGGVPTDDLGLAVLGRAVGADFHVYRVDGNGVHVDQQVMVAGHGFLK